MIHPKLAFNFVAASVLALVTLGTSNTAFAGLDTNWRTQINKACDKRVKKGQADLCACIADRHFVEATREEPAEGERYLKLILSFYEETNLKKLQDLLDKNEIEAELDIQIASQCEDDLKPQTPSKSSSRDKKPANKK